MVLLVGQYFFIYVSLQLRTFCINFNLSLQQEAIELSIIHNQV